MAAGFIIVIIVTSHRSYRFSQSQSESDRRCLSSVSLRQPLGRPPLAASDRLLQVTHSAPPRRQCTAPPARPARRPQRRVRLRRRPRTRPMMCAGGRAWWCWRLSTFDPNQGQGHYQTDRFKNNAGTERGSQLISFHLISSSVEAPSPSPSERRSVLDLSCSCASSELHQFEKTLFGMSVH